MRPSGTRILFVSGSIGLGHAMRDLAIARELRALEPAIEITWLAGDAARTTIASAGERLAPEAEHYATGTAVVESARDGFTLNLSQPPPLRKLPAYLRGLRRFVADLKSNVHLFRQATSRERFDAIVGDETFELALAFRNNPRLRNAPFVLIIDYVGNDATTSSIVERLLVRMFNRGWTRLLSGAPPLCEACLFVGEEDDVPAGRLGWRLPDRRALARGGATFVGYITRFDASTLADRAAVRAGFGYGDEPRIVCSIGGTAVGAPLLELCAAAFPVFREKMPEARMLLVCGPRIDPRTVRAPKGVEVIGYASDLHLRFAACDLAVVQGGGTTTLELTALRRPFIYFPIEEHFEQQFHVAWRLKRHGAGVRLEYSTTTPPRLAEVMVDTMTRGADWPPIAADGARRAAEIIRRLATSARPA